MEEEGEMLDPSLDSKMKVRETDNGDGSRFKNFIRMEPAMFYKLRQKLGPAIAQRDIWYPSLFILD